MSVTRKHIIRLTQNTDYGDLRCLLAKNRITSVGINFLNDMIDFSDNPITKSFKIIQKKNHEMMKWFINGDPKN